jgi:tetratricopeptide (TPR) repeat protein
MSKPIVKYNPAFLPKDELVRSFVVRHAELELIVQVLRENMTQSNQHVLVIGSRGTGKTMLTLRLAEEVLKEEDLNECWYPLVFAEESYQVTTPGEFWLEALFHLRQKTGEARWKQTFKELSGEQDEARLRERALAQLMDFADEQGKRILLVVENFHMLLGEQISDGDGWVLRHTLLNEPRVMLLATATSRFQEIDNSGKPMFELFKTLELEPLDESQCRTLWASITGNEPNDERVRPIQILTGGNPRLLTIISGFASRLSLKELMADLMQLVDEHTEYFKSHLDGLPPIERKVYLGLAELWDPATAREVANAARLDVNKTSSLLRRLMERGAVVLADGRKRTKLYQVAERMYNIYYLMRRRGAPSRRVKAVVRFMANFYGQKELVNLTQRIAEEACSLKPELRMEHFWAYEAMLESASTQSLRDKLIKVAPHDFFEMPDVPASLRSLADKRLLTLLKEAAALSEKPDQLEEAERIYRKAIDVAPQRAVPWAKLGQLLHEKLGRYDEAEQAYRKAIALKPEASWAWVSLGQLLHENLNQYEEAEKLYRRAIELKPDYTWAYVQLARVLRDHLKRYEDAEKMYRKAIELEPEHHGLWEEFGRLLHKPLALYEESETAYRKAIELGPDCSLLWAYLGDLLSEGFRRYKEAEKAYRKAIELGPDNALAWSHFGHFLHVDLCRPDEAEKAYRKAIEIDADYPCPWVYIGKLLQERKRYGEAEKAYRMAIEKGLDCSYAWVELGRLLDERLGRYEEAEIAYQKAIELEPGSVLPLKNIVALLQERLNRPDDALKLVEKHLEKTDSVEKGVNNVIDMFVGLAAAGYGQRVLEIVRESPSAKILEPLVVGLQLFVGEDVKAAAEIMEVGKDVVKRIEQRRDEIRSRTEKEQGQQTGQEGKGRGTKES